MNTQAVYYLLSRLQRTEVGYMWRWPWVPWVLVGAGGVCWVPWIKRQGRQKLGRHKGGTVNIVHHYRMFRLWGTTPGRRTSSRLIWLPIDICSWHFTLHICESRFIGSCHDWSLSVGRNRPWSIEKPSIDPDGIWAWKLWYSIWWLQLVT